MADEEVFDVENDLPKFLESVLNKVESSFQSNADLEVAESHSEVIDQSIRLIRSISEFADVETQDKLDSTSFFHEAARGADNDASGVVVLLAVAKALGELKREGKIKPPDLKNGEKHIMFTFFQGEAWDYIGSSRMVFDMIQGKFPCVKDCTKVNISNIAYFLELNQVGLYNEGLWAHSDPLSKSNVGTKVSEMFKTLSDFAANASLLIGNASDKTAQPLPPASFQRFLRKSLHIPGLVVTDHKASYTNKYYNSRLDEWYNLNFNGSFNSPIVKRLTSLAETVANALYKLAYSKTRTDGNVLLKHEDVGDLLACFLVSKNCSTFRKATTEQDLHILEKKTRPFGRYVGTYKKQKVRYHPITTMTGRVLSYFMRNEKCDTSTATCSGNQENFIFNSTEGCCVNSSAFPYPAMSPAFLLEDYTSTEYSTWTESSWGDDIAIRMFLLPDPVQEVITLIVGIVLTLLSIMVTVFMYTKAEQLFTPDDCVLVINNVQ